MTIWSHVKAASSLDKRGNRQLPIATECAGIYDVRGNWSDSVRIRREQFPCTPLLTMAKEMA